MACEDIAISGLRSGQLKATAPPAADAGVTRVSPRVPGSPFSRAEPYQSRIDVPARLAMSPDVGGCRREREIEAARKRAG